MACPLPEGIATDEYPARRNFVESRHALDERVRILVGVLEGGYALSALGRSVVQHVRVLAGLN